MANPGVGNKFLSVNLNKSYGQQHHNHHPHNAGTYGTARTRPGSGGGRGGGMVVLSRPRSSHKTGPKLSVPPPLNLPSLRKEHERFDSSGSSVGPSGGVLGSGSRPTSSGVGWTKAATFTSQEKEVVDYHDNADPGLQMKVDGASKGSGNLYTPPNVRSVTVAAAVSGYSQVNKATVLRGEDFPSLRATLLTTVGNEKKQKDVLNQKQKQLINEDFSDEQRENSRLRSSHDGVEHPQFQPPSQNGGLNGNGGQSNGLGGYREQARKRDEYFPGPLPVTFNPRSDWEDDERDTGRVLTDRSRDHVFSKNELYWDRDFDLPRANVLPHKPAHSLSERWGQRDNEAGKFFPVEGPKTDPSGRDIRTPSREGHERNSWRVPSLLKDELNAQDVGKDRNFVDATPSGLNRETIKENKYVPSPLLDITQVDTGRREMGHAQEERQSWNNSVDSHGSRPVEWNTKEGYGSEQSNRYRGNNFENNTASKPSYSSGSKLPSVNDPMLNFSREKRPFLKSEKPFLEDSLMKDYSSTGFDGRDPFPGGLIGVVKRKKDVVKQTDFHDPVRESFEAELERVQKMQELERQRIIEEQERSIELARQEEEERLRLAREEEERQRRLEEEAREAAWRAEQEKIEALRRAEEQRIAREEEKRMMIMEEERRKQAAKQKLMELEERIAKRQAEVAMGGSSSALLQDVTMSGLAKEKEVSKPADANDLEDGERMVERMTSSASSDSSGLNRHFEMGSRPHLSRDVSSSVLDRGKPVNSWRRDVFENGNRSTFTLPDQDTGHHTAGRDTFSGGRAFPRKEFHGGAGFMPSRTFHKGGILEPDDFSHFRGQRWTVPGNGDHYSRHTEFESEYHENFPEKFGDTGWGQDRSHGSPYTSYSERMQPNSEADDLYSFGRSRYSMRQPRVLPPPSFTSMNRSQYRGGNELTSTSNIAENEMPYDHGSRSEATMQTESDHEGILGQAEIADTQREKTEDVEQKLGENTVRCDSQSSLSVTSPPDSPIHLSHDDIEESGDSPVLSAAEEGKELDLSGRGPGGSSVGTGRENLMSASASIGDDEEWTLNNNEQLQEQEEYEEDEDGYQEEDEVHDIGDDLVQEFEEMRLEGKDSLEVVDNLVLGFNEGVEVGMPCDEFERNARNEETAYVKPHTSVANINEEGSFNTVDHNGHILSSVNVQSQVNVDDSSRIFQETERAIQDLAVQPTIALKTSASSDMMDHMHNSNTSGSTQQHSISSTLVQTVVSAASSAPSPTDAPVKLQFGLFSGPSLIPSPVPAIQIGSIQMPLHLHPQVGPSLAHIHPSQGSVFQFGQLRYTTPLSQGVLPLAPQSVSFVQPSVPASFSLHKNQGGPLQPAHEITAENLIKNSVVSALMDNQPGLVPRPLDLSNGIGVMNGYNSMPARENQEVIQQDHKETSVPIGNILKPESELQAEDSLVKNLKFASNKDFGGQPRTGVASLHSAAKEKDTRTSKGQDLASAGRGKKYILSVKNSGSRSSIWAPDASISDFSGIQRRPRRQRTEFRVRENADKNQSSDMIPSNQFSLDDKSDTNGEGTGISTRIGSRRMVVTNRPSKQTFDLEALRPGLTNSQGIDSRSRPGKGGGKESSVKSHSADGTLKRNIRSGEDVDAPLQSGIVRVFEQPGIEAPSDDDDFIEVRSKRQMLNDRREQRQKETKAKTHSAKALRKPRSMLQKTIASGTSNKISTPIRPEFVASKGHVFSNSEVSSGFNSLVSQPLAPIGTPAVKSDNHSDIRSQPIKSLQTSSLPVGYSSGNNLPPASNKVLHSVQTSLSPWGNSRVSQQALPISQAQLDEAMKPAEFDSASFVDHSSSVSSSSMSSSTILMKDKSFPSASPINSLLAGEKIQFGAVTSPTVLPPSSHAVSHGIGPSGPCRSDIQISHNLSATDNDCSLFFEKDKHSNESCVHLEDSEAEAEAAASAIAVAAISSDDIVGNGLGTCSMSVSDTKSFVCAEIDGTGAGVAGDLQSGTQSREEESLSLALPADLSVETPSISLWPSLPSPQNNSSQMISHFPGAPPPHFPFYEMNPMLGGPFFAFGPHDESSSSQSQCQKTSTSVSGPIGSWQQHHSGVDSFNGTPAGFNGPFISTPAAIPGFQGPPHMVVYNHFAPVGQFGQVGLSFMGTTYIPSGKQPDWKHNPVSLAMNVGEGGDMSNLNMVSAQRNSDNMAAIQHLAPGSPLLPLASPLAMFDVSRFQSLPDMPVQAPWPHISAQPLQQSVPLSMPLQQPAEVQMPSQFNPVHHLDQTLSTNRFPECQTSVSSDNSQKFAVSTHATVTQLPDELGLVDQTTSSSAGPSTQNVSVSSFGGANDVGKSDIRNGRGSNNNTGQNSCSSFKPSSAHHKNTSGQYGNSSGHNHRRGSGIPQGNRMGFQGKNQSSGPEKSFPHLKMKQVYVAKQTTSGNSKAL